MKIIYIILLTLCSQMLFGQYNFGVDMCGQDAKIEGRLNLQTTDFSVYLGKDAGVNQNLITGFSSTNQFIGGNAGNQSINGKNSILVGYGAGEFGDQITNISLGGFAGTNNLGGANTYNIHIGYQAGQNAQGSSSISVGYLAGKEVKANNTYIGHRSGEKCTGDWNTTLGAFSGWNPGPQSYNTFLGHESGKHATGNYNVYAGFFSGKSAGQGSNNVSLGTSAGQHAIGNKNVFIGHQAGYKFGGTPPDSANVFIGYQAGANEAGSDKLYIENSNSTTPLIWGDFLTDDLAINGDLYVNGLLTYGSCMASSDIRFKKNIHELKDVLTDLRQVRAITHEWRHDEFPNKKWRQGLEYGVIAQELEEVFPHAVMNDKDGYKMVDYTKLNPIILQAINEQHEILKDHKQTLNSITDETNKLTELDKRLAAIEAQVEADSSK